MSRVGKLPVKIPSGVNFSVDSERNIVVKGPKGELQFRLSEEVSCEYDASAAAVSFSVSNQGDIAAAPALWGLSRSMVNNMVSGVSNGFDKRLELVGVGYKASMLDDRHLLLSLGHSHDIVYAVPNGISIKCEKNLGIVISGVDKQLVGQVAAEIRAFRKPEPYKGKGIRYAGEFVRRKEGKRK